MLSEFVQRHLAVHGDVPALLDIYNEVIANTTAVYALVPGTLAERHAWFKARVEGGYPVLVAEGSEGIGGYSSFGDARGTWSTYRYSVEHSVHVHAGWRGKGVGTQLVRTLFPLAAAMGTHVMIGAVDASNSASLRMHEQIGFERAAHFREVGHKFGRWLNLVFVQRFIDPEGSSWSA